MNKFVVVFVALNSLIGISNALNCYICSCGESDADKSCIDDPASTSTKNCNKQYCTIIRQEYKDPRDVVVSMMRTCEDNPQHMNEIVEDDTFRFYYKACSDDLCNSGSGKAGDDSDGGSGLGDKSNLIVPGTGGAYEHTISFTLIILFIATILFKL